MTNKKTLQRLKLDPYLSKSIDTNLNVWSHDVNSYEIKFEFYDSECDKPIDLTGADMRILLDHADSQPKVYPLEIESKILGLAKFVMPKEIRGCEGKFTAHIYADYPNKTHDFGSFVFKTNVSRIDKSLGGCLDTVYVSEFEKALKEIKDKNSQFHIIEGKLNARIDKIENDINSKEIVKQSEFNKLEHNFETFTIGATNRFSYKRINQNIKVVGRRIELEGSWPTTIMSNANLRSLRLSAGTTYKMRYFFRLDEEPGENIPFEQNNHGTLALYSGVDGTKYPTIELGLKNDNVEEAKKMKKGSVVSRTFEFTMPKDFSEASDYKIVAYTYRAMTPQGVFVKNLAGSFIDIQIEYGSKFTDNQPAFEDLATYQEANALQKQIDDLKKAITTLGGTL